MLPPLRSSSGSTSSYQNQSSLNGSGPSVAEAAYKVHFADWKGDSNSSSAGKLNVLLLAGRERIADHLAMLADAVGRAIDLPRRENEGNGDYVIRLAEALAKLTPRQRADVERQLNLVVQGLKLRFLFEAFGNPTGPQAARIVAYLETARYKDRDLVARSVVTSYRQNGGPDAGSNEHAPATAAMPVQGETGEAQTAGKPQAAQAPTPARPQLPVQNDVPADLMRVLAGEADIEPILESATGPLPETAADGSDAALPAPAYTDIDQDSGIDARSLQVLLRRAFEGGESGDAAIEAKATAELLAAAEDRTVIDIASDIETLVEEPVEFELDARFQPDAPTQRQNAPEARPLPRAALAPTAADIPSEHDHTADAPQPGEGRDRVSSPHRIADAFATAIQEREDYQPTLYTLKGWTEADFDARDLATAYEIIAEEGEEAHAMIAAGAEDESMPPRDASEALPLAEAAELPLDDSDSLYDPRSAAGLNGEAADEKVTTRQPPAPEKTLAETFAAKAVPVAVERQVLAQLLPTGRETPLFGVAPFSPLPDVLSYEDEKETEEQRFRDDQSEGDDAGDDHEAEQQEGDENRRAAAEIAMEDDEDQSERAYGLYQRMSGWA